MVQIGALPQWSFSIFEYIDDLLHLLNVPIQDMGIILIVHHSQIVYRGSDRGLCKQRQLRVTHQHMGLTSCAHIMG